METILILDDNKACSACLKMTLMGHGYRVSRTSDVQYVINHAWNDEFDLLLINQAHGNACGWEVFNHLNRIAPHLPAMVYVMDHPRTSTATWIAKAVEAVIYETKHAASRCSGVATTCADDVKNSLRVIRSGGEME
jgi:DNA-binding NtrC family response regulator